MSVARTRAIIALLRVLVGLLWWGVAIGVPVWAVAAVTAHTLGQIPLTFPLGFAVQVSPADAPLVVDAGERSAEVRELVGSISFTTLPPAEFAGVATVWALERILALPVLWHLRRILDSLRSATPFREHNARRLRTLAITVIVVGLARGAIQVSLGVYASMALSTNDVALGAALRFSGTTLLIGLGLLITAEVVRAGTALHDDQALTV